MEIAKRKRVEKERLKKLLGYSECSATICCDSGNFLHFGPDGTILPKIYTDWALQVREMTAEKDDTWLVSTMPNFETSLLDELVWLLRNNLDFDKAKQTKLEARVPLLELSVIQNCFDESGGNTSLASRDSQIVLNTVQNMDSPRLIKTHLPLSLLPGEIFEKQCKVIYTTVNPKKASLSAFHYAVTHYGYKRSLTNFLENFVADHALYGPYWNHVKGFYGLHRNSWPNLLFLTCEEIQKDLKGTILKTAKFIGKEEVLSAENLNKVMAYLNAEQERGGQLRKKAVSLLVQKDGKGISSPEEFPLEINQKFEEWMQKNEIPGLF